MNSSLQRHIEARRKKMKVDRILNQSKAEKLRKVKRHINYFSNIAVHYV